MESIPLTTSDGHTLEADLLLPDLPCIGGAVVCHPHPQFGGNRFNPVVEAVFRRLPQIGFATLRFDFRSSVDGGNAERLDVVAALDELERRKIGPMVTVGYSFGAAVALSTDDDRITSIVAIAAPLGMMTVDPPSVPVLAFVPQHDQFTDPDAARTATADWASIELRTVESADHFLVGQASTVSDAAAEWLVARQ